MEVPTDSLDQTESSRDAVMYAKPLPFSKLSGHVFYVSQLDVGI